jgi:hypothetical protein
MNPRLQSAPLTTQDQLIWNWLCELQFSRYQIRGRFRAGMSDDRRDADLMWKLSTYTHVAHPPVIHILLRVDPTFDFSDFEALPPSWLSI